MFLHLSVSHSVRRGGRAWWGHAWQVGHSRGCVWQGCVCGGGGACMAGGMHGRRACMARGAYMAGGMLGRGMHVRGHVWWEGIRSRGACVAGGDMHGRGGACMVEGVCMAGGMQGRGACVVRGACVAGGCACHAHPPDTMRYGRSMRGRYASYWNAFLLLGSSQSCCSFDADAWQKRALTLDDHFSILKQLKCYCTSCSPRSWLFG